MHAFSEFEWRGGGVDVEPLSVFRTLATAGVNFVHLYCLSSGIDEAKVKGLGKDDVGRICGMI